MKLTQYWSNLPESIPGINLLWSKLTFAFVILCLLVWVDEIIDISHFLFRTPNTPINWREAVTETILILTVGFFTISRLQPKTKLRIEAKTLSGTTRIWFPIILSFSVLCMIIWMNELLDIPYLLLRGEKTPVNLPEAIGESILIVLLGIFAVVLIIRNITKRSWAEDMFYRSFYFNPIPAAITTLTNENVIQANDAFVELSGYKREKIMGNSLINLNIWEKSDKRKEMIDVIKEKGSIRNIEVEVKNAAGDTRNCLFSSELIEFENEPHILSMALDITDRKSAEQSLLKAEARYRNMFENTMNGVAVYKALNNGEDFLFVDFNKAAEKIDHIQKGNVIGKTLLSIFPKIKEFGLFDVFKRVWETGLSEHFPVSYYVDGRIAGWRENFVYKLPSGEIVAVYSDETARKTAEDELRERQRELLTLLGNLPGMAYRCKNDTERTIEFISDGCIGITGYSPKELQEGKGVCLGKLIHPDDQDSVLNTIWTALKNREQFELVYRIISKKGHDRWVWEKGIGVFTPGGELNALEGFITDITEQKRTKEELDISENKFSKAFHVSPDWITITTLKDGICLDANEAFLLTTGYSMNDVIGRSTIELKIWEKPDDRSMVMNKIAEEGGVKNEEVRFRTKSGEIRTILFSAESFSFGGENCILSIGRDITDRKILEGKLNQLQKMEAIGRLAGGIAHDFNNLLTAIDLYCELTLKKIDQIEQVRFNINQIKEIEKTAASIVDQLLAFSRKQVRRPKILDINEVVRNLKHLLVHFIGENVELKEALSPEICRINVDQGQIEQIIINLALNARDAMPNGGKLIIETSNVYVDKNTFRKHHDVEDGNYIQMKISDTGFGMDEETMTHIFEPFFTTKGEGKGTGLGLSTVYGIVKQSGGHIWVEGELDKGSAFHILFPLIEDYKVDSTNDGEVEESLKGNETVLLVEDNDHIKELASEILQSQGYTVISAKDGFEAINICKKIKGSIDILVTDVVLPKMNGRQLADNLLQQHNDMQILYISGYQDDIIAQYGILDADKNLLQKPFSPSELINKVREIMDLKYKK